MNEINLCRWDINVIAHFSYCPVISGFVSVSVVNSMERSLRITHYDEIPVGERVGLF